MFSHGYGGSYCLPPAREKLVAFKCESSRHPRTSGEEAGEASQGTHSHTHTLTPKEIGNAMEPRQWSAQGGSEARIPKHLCISAWDWDPCRDKREGKKKT